ncbi:hypothetical protein SAMN02746065_107150 [Desulfocicer vacuolatum DSM 3385]|uniref:Uncharacterized protein n=1 Tax=Desulfocicer vacuolatum DSM 3385 TaxID=1121400 RepID=A0A1W2B9L5_9BACT|nr:hypothetical protein [Desulfocicer vacuolatum]SMC69470.1 hypothetical protein SAMN02746065_107150 [Desulfocicer vacuolatum DSM 3385]
MQQERSPGFCLILDNSISYLAFRFNVEEVMAEYPGLLNVARDYLNAFIQPEQIMPTDVKILTGWLKEQLKPLEG